MFARRLLSCYFSGLDLRDQLTFEFGFKLSTDFSHYEYPAPPARTGKIGGREGLWKMPQLWKSTKDAFGDFFLMISTSCLEKPPQKTLRLSHIYHSPDDYGPYSSGSRSLSRSACTKLGRKTLHSTGCSQVQLFKNPSSFSKNRAVVGKSVQLFEELRGCSKFCPVVRTTVQLFEILSSLSKNCAAVRNSVRLFEQLCSCLKFCPVCRRTAQIFESPRIVGHGA